MTRRGVPVEKVEGLNNMIRQKIKDQEASDNLQEADK